MRWNATGHITRKPSLLSGLLPSAPGSHRICCPQPLGCSFGWALVGLSA